METEDSRRNARRVQAEGPDSDVVVVNARGERFETCATTLEQIAFVAAKRNFEGGQNEIQLDMDPDVFRVMLELARNRGHEFLRSLSGELMFRVRQDVDYYCLHHLFPGFLFGLEPTRFAYIVQDKVDGGIFLTRGRVPMRNTVLADTPIPRSGLSYWEVEIMSLGVCSSAFAVGIAEKDVRKDKAFTASCNAGILAAGVILGDDGVWLQTMAGDQDVPYSHTQFPSPQKGSRIGMLVDMDTGMFSFFFDGKFHLIHPKVDTRGVELFPVFTVYADTVLKVHTGLMAPITCGDALHL